MCVCFAVFVFMSRATGHGESFVSGAAEESSLLQQSKPECLMQQYIVDR